MCVCVRVVALRHGNGVCVQAGYTHTHCVVLIVCDQIVLSFGLPQQAKHHFSSSASSFLIINDALRMFSCRTMSYNRADIILLCFSIDSPIAKDNISSKVCFVYICVCACVRVHALFVVRSVRSLCACFCIEIRVRSLSKQSVFLLLLSPDIVTPLECHVRVCDARQKKILSLTHDDVV